LIDSSVGQWRWVSKSSNAIGQHWTAVSEKWIGVYGTGAGLRQNNKYDIVPTFRQRTGPDYHFYSLGQNHTYFLSLEMLRISALSIVSPDMGAMAPTATIRHC